MASPLQMTEMYDNALLGILQHVGNVQDFLQTFKLFEKLADHDRERLISEQQKREESKRGPLAVQELEVTCESPEEMTEQSSTEPSQTDGVHSGTGGDCVAVGPDKSVGPQGSSEAEVQEDQAAAGCTAEESKKTSRLDSDSYNGAVRENYSWSQDYMDVEVRVFVPKEVVKGKQVSVSLQSGSVRVCVRDGAEERTLMEGEFTHKINTENSLWSLEPGSCVLLSLSKTSEVWWNAVLKGEEEIDINQINRERTMASVDEEEHAVLDRLTFDYHQKLQGKPQSHEMKVHEMLKKGWDAEGSPFKGQEFDPSMFDIPPSAVQF